jgi:hypothetical protein
MKCRYEDWTDSQNSNVDKSGHRAKNLIDCVIWRNAQKRRNGAPSAIRTRDPRLRRAPRRKGVNRFTPAKSVYPMFIKACREIVSQTDFHLLTPMVTVTSQKWLKMLVKINHFGPLRKHIIITWLFLYMTKLTV